jgi:hypothetical protein
VIRPFGPAVLKDALACAVWADPVRVVAPPSFVPALGGFLLQSLTMQSKGTSREMAETFGADVCAVDSGGTSDRHTGRERASEIQTKRQFIGSLENSHRKNKCSAHSHRASERRLPTLELQNLSAGKGKGESVATFLEAVVTVWLRPAPTDFYLPANRVRPEMRTSMQLF